MAQKRWRSLTRRWLAVLLVMQTVSCGTILYPERIGQPAGRIDPGVVALDAVGLLLFFVPGVIAFVVDFSNGTIYLPPERSTVASSPAGQPWQTVHVDPAELTHQKLEAVVREQTGEPVCLEPGNYRATRISHIQDFTPTTLDQLQAAPVVGTVVFRGIAE